MNVIIFYNTMVNCDGPFHDYYNVFDFSLEHIEITTNEFFNLFFFFYDCRNS